MPTYPYRCTKCGHTFDLFQKITDEPVKDCPACNEKDQVQREIGGGAALLQFKGTGYYITDYKRSADPEAKPSSGSGCACCRNPKDCSS